MQIFEKKDNESEKLDKYVSDLLEILNLAVDSNESNNEKNTTDA